MGERLARALGIIFIGAIVWTIAKRLTDDQLGAIPTLIIVGPFIYWAYRAWNPSSTGPTDTGEKSQEPHRDMEKRLEAVAANQELPLETREDAKRRLALLRKEKAQR